jgi:hypothetical protein
MEWVAVLVVVMASWVITSVEGELEWAVAARIGDAAARRSRAGYKI